MTFKQYLESKEQLKQALNNTPKTIIEYEICNYCSIHVGETLEESKTIILKPKQKIIVEWSYLNKDNPEPVYIKFLNVKNINEDEEIPVFWNGTRLQKWLKRHTYESKKKKIVSNVSTTSKFSLGSSEALAQQSTTGILGNITR